MLLSNDLSSPDISVPINVTEEIPMIIPRAVKMERVLLAKTADREILKFSKKSKIMRTSILHLQLSYHQINE